MTVSREDQLFSANAELADENLQLKDDLNDATVILNAIWEARVLTQPLWTKIAEFLECPEDETPIVYTPEFVTQSDLLSLQRRVAKLERNLTTEPMSIPK
jgi:hypothetical protein